MRFTSEIRVEWGDVDAAGVVYFPHFFRYFSITETGFYRSLGWNMLDLEESLEIRLPRVNAGCQFMRPARFGDLLKISMEIESITTKAIKYLFEVQRQAEMIATGYLVVASVSITDFKAVPLPDKLRDLLKSYTRGDQGNNLETEDS